MIVGIFLLLSLSTLLMPEQLVDAWLVPSLTDSLLLWSTWIKLLGYQFVHAGISHLSGNLFVIFPAMLYLEPRIGKLKLTILFLLGGVVSALVFFLACNFDQMTAVSILLGQAPHLVGSSGSAFCIATVGMLALARENPVTTGTVMALALINQLIGCMVAMTHAVPVAYWGHMGGIMAGLCLFGLLGPQASLVGTPAPKPRGRPKLLK